MSKILVSKIRNLNTVVIKQVEGQRAFISTPDSILISIPSLAMIIKFLIKEGFMDKRVLYGILSELEE